MPENKEKRSFQIQNEAGEQYRIEINPIQEQDTAPDYQLNENKDLVLRLTSEGQVHLQVDRKLPWHHKSNLKAWIKRWPYSLPQTLFVFALALYTLTRMIGITNYPIYFFTDEAIQTNLAADFMRDNFRNYDGELFPTYFENVNKYSLSLTVYAQVIPYLLFGKSILVTRLTAALFTVLGAYWLGLILRDGFGLKYWWLGTILLSITPAWFLHSRTAFETCMFASLYAGFLYFYLLYRKKDPKHLYWALTLGALTFYSYNPGRIVIVLSGLFFLISDFRYHWQQRKTSLLGLAVLVILALPFIRFYRAHPTAQIDQLRLLASYWVQPIPLGEKVAAFFNKYLYALSPGYWFIPNDQDLSRHIMGRLPHIYTQLFLFWALGVLISLRYIKKPEYRIVLLALIAAPSGSALVGVGITRAMAYLIPALALVALGFEAGLKWLERRGIPSNVIAISVFSLLAAVNILLLVSALTVGPLWDKNYGLSGMQYGAKQLHAAINDYLEENPGADLFVSPNWTNGAQVVSNFFYNDGAPFESGSTDIYIHNLMADTEERTFVVIPNEYEDILESQKFKTVEILETVTYPDGRPGFLFLKLAYVDDIAEILAKEIEERRQLVDDTVFLSEDDAVPIKYSPTDMGNIQYLFDGDDHTLARTAEANPFIIDLNLRESRTYQGLTANIGSALVEITVTFYQDEQETGQVLEQFRGSVDHPVVTFDFDTPIPSDRMVISIRDLTQQEPANVHLWEIELIP